MEAYVVVQEIVKWTAAAVHDGCRRLHIARTILMWEGHPSSSIALELLVYKVAYKGSDSRTGICNDSADDEHFGEGGMGGAGWTEKDGDRMIFAEASGRVKVKFVDDKDITAVRGRRMLHRLELA